MESSDSNGDPVLDFRSEATWFNLSGAVTCVIFAAMAAGLTIGLMSLDPIELELKKRVGTDREKRMASKVLPLIGRHHLLLVTLLLFNSIANETLPIFLAEVFPNYVAVILSVTLLLFFGEIIPTALFTGPAQLIITSKLSGLVWLVICVFFPVAYPISWLLDKLLGHEGLRRYTREEIGALMELQREFGKHGLDVSHPLITSDEVTIVGGVLKCHAKCVRDAMTPIEEVYSLSTEDVLDEDAMLSIMASGFSRIPVYEGKNPKDIRGFLLVKRLIVVDADENRPIGSLPLREPVVVSPADSLLEVLNIFQLGRSHLALVSNSPVETVTCLKTGHRTPVEGAGAPIGIITLEDIIEEILQEEILDEADMREKKALDTLKKIRRGKLKEELKHPRKTALLHHAMSLPSNAFNGRISPKEFADRISPKDRVALLSSKTRDSDYKTLSANNSPSIV